MSVVDEGFDVEYVEPGGVVRRADLSMCWDVRFEDAPLVRSFPSVRGQAHFPGLRWSATSGGHVGYESWLERDIAMLLDFDLDVVGVLVPAVLAALVAYGRRWWVAHAHTYWAIINISMWRGRSTDDR